MYHDQGNVRVGLKLSCGSGLKPAVCGFTSLYVSVCVALKAGASLAAALVHVYGIEIMIIFFSQVSGNASIKRPQSTKYHFNKIQSHWIRALVERLILRHFTTLCLRLVLLAAQSTPAPSLPPSRSHKWHLPTCPVFSTLLLKKCKSLRKERHQSCSPKSYRISIHKLWSNYLNSAKSTLRFL